MSRRHKISFEDVGMYELFLVRPTGPIIYMKVGDDVIVPLFTFFNPPIVNDFSGKQNVIDVEHARWHYYPVETLLYAGNTKVGYSVNAERIGRYKITCFSREEIEKQHYASVAKIKPYSFLLDGIYRDILLKTPNGCLSMLDFYPTKHQHECVISLSIDFFLEEEYIGRYNPV